MINRIARYFARYSDQLKQPTPTLVITTRLDHYTAITRQWADGEHHRCRLCDRCEASQGGTCTVLVDEPVEDSAAALYSTCGMPS